jgi:transcriptional regulator with XRE-family HTH domain
MSKQQTQGEVFKAARLAKKLTQVEVSEKVGIHWNTYAKMERDLQDPTFQNLKKIAKVLNLDLNKLPE